MNASHRPSPESASCVCAAPGTAAIPCPPPPPAGGALPIGKRVSFSVSTVERSTTDASPSFGASTYANHRPSFDSAVERIVRHALRSAVVI